MFVNNILLSKIHLKTLHKLTYPFIYTKISLPPPPSPLIVTSISLIDCMIFLHVRKYYFTINPQPKPLHKTCPPNLYKKNSILCTHMDGIQGSGQCRQKLDRNLEKLGKGKKFLGVIW